MLSVKEVRPVLLAQDEPVSTPRGLAVCGQQLSAYRSFLRSLGSRFLGVLTPSRGGSYGNSA